MPINLKHYRHHPAMFGLLKEKLNELVPTNTRYKPVSDNPQELSGYYALPPFTSITNQMVKNAFHKSLVECFGALNGVFYKLADEVVELVTSNTNEKNKSEIQLKIAKMQALREIYCALLWHYLHKPVEETSKTFSEVLSEALRDENVMKGFDSSTKRVITMVSNLPLEGTLEVRIRELNQKIADYGNKTGAGFAFSGREFKDKEVKKSAAEKLKRYVAFEVTKSGRQPDKLTENELKAAQQGALGEIYKKFPQELRAKIKNEVEAEIAIQAKSKL